MIGYGGYDTHIRFMLEFGTSMLAEMPRPPVQKIQIRSRNKYSGDDLVKIRAKNGVGRPPAVYKQRKAYLEGTE